MCQCLVPVEYVGTLLFRQSGPVAHSTHEKQVIQTVEVHISCSGAQDADAQHPLQYIGLKIKGNVQRVWKCMQRKVCINDVRWQSLRIVLLVCKHQNVLIPSTLVM